MNTLESAPPLHRPWPIEPTAFTVVALGDSITSGEGVGIDTPPEATWAALLARQLAASGFHNLARAGARLVHVRAEQLPLARDLRPQLATVCVGLNDIVKTGCEQARIAEDLGALTEGLRSTGAHVVLTRLHDPAAVFRMPRGLAAQIGNRVRVLNDAVDAAAADDPGVTVVDLASLQAQRACWAVDRVHPSPWGQRVLFERAAGRLGLAVPYTGLEPPRPPSGLAHARWLVRCGAPWLAERWGEVGPVVAGMWVTALRHRRAPAMADLP